MIDLTRKPERCRHCRRIKGDHKAITLECPKGRGSWPTYITGQVFEAVVPRSPRPNA